MNRRAFITAAVLVVHALPCARAFTPHDLAFSGRPVTTVGTPTDDFDSYSAGVDIDSLNGGTNWSAAYVSRGEDFPPTDNFSNYAADQELSGLNGGSNWIGVYTSRETVSPLDTFASYSDTNDLSGLNSGTNWTEAYISR